MNGLTVETVEPSTPEYSGVEFGKSADGLTVARVGGMIFAMVPGRNGQLFLSSAWRVSRPLADLKRDDFYSHDGMIEDETAFHSRMFEQAEHSRELRSLARRSVRIHCNTPWGPSQGATIYAEGVVSHTTAGHGGFKLSGERNSVVHPSLRSDSGFYEEDSEGAIVALTFPSLFTTYERKCADQTIRNSWPDAWEAVHGRVLSAGESMEKDRRAFEKQHAGSWIVISAILSDQHPGMTEVIATVGGSRQFSCEERRFLVANDEYRARARFGFVIDEARHQAYEGPSSFVGWCRRAA
jgi:hypothetical protein